MCINPADSAAVEFVIAEQIKSFAKAAVGISGCIGTDASFRSAASPAWPLRKCSIQTELSTGIIKKRPRGGAQSAPPARVDERRLFFNPRQPP